MEMEFKLEDYKKGLQKVKGIKKVKLEETKKAIFFYMTINSEELNNILDRVNNIERELRRKFKDKLLIFHFIILKKKIQKKCSK